MTPAGSPPNTFTEAKQNKTVSLNTNVQGHQLQSHNLIWAALYFVISVGGDSGRGSTNTILQEILNNAREISVQ